jgi:N-acetylmuramic acid 6-phosphate (MurNAc-6-P) etherase
MRAQLIPLKKGCAAKKITLNTLSTVTKIKSKNCCKAKSWGRN